MLYLYMFFAMITTYSALYETWTATVFFASLAGICVALFWHKEMQL